MYFLCKAHKKAQKKLFCEFCAFWWPELSRDCFPVLRQMLGGAPRQCLKGERRIVRPACPHDGRAENPEIRRFVRKTPAIDNVRFRIVAHACAAVCVRGHSHGPDLGALDRNRTGSSVPLLHLVLHEEREPSLVFLVLGCDSNYWKPERIANLRLKVQVIVLIRTRVLLA